MKKSRLIFVALIGLFAQPVFADLFGLPNGRSANLDNLGDISVEGGVSIGSDATTFAARLNYKVSPDAMVFGTFGQIKYDFVGGDDSGTNFGIGAFYQLRNVELVENTAFALKGAYHASSLDNIDLSEISFDAIVSSDELGSTSLGWYANAGLHIVKADVDFGFARGSNSDTELLFGGGVTGPLSFGDWYAGIDFIDGALLAAGVRYNIE